LARQRLRSEAHYRRFQQFQAAAILNELAHQGVHLAGRRVLDLGCGNGGYTLEMHKRGARAFALERYVVSEVQQLFISDSAHIALQDGTMDVVFCASVIEHVPQPSALLREIHRVLKSDGLCYLSFPPFYSLNGGHHFKPYHWLGEKVALRMRGGQHKSYAEAYGEWGLYVLTLRQAKQEIANAGFTIQSLNTRFMPINFAQWPVLGEVLCWHAEFLLRLIPHL
jgi:ubiquinone/menaquinone biosynthesis C-methylase UbiE